MPMKGFGKCCFCVSLPWAARIIGIAGLLPCFTIGVYMIDYAARHPTFKRSPWSPSDILHAVVILMQVVSNVTLLIGSFKAKRLYLLPWLGVLLVYMGAQIYVLAYIVSQTHAYELLLGLLFVLFEIYLWLVILAFYLSILGRKSTQAARENIYSDLS